MTDTVLYIHGQGGSAAEAEHYRPLFPGFEVVGPDELSRTPWESGEEIRAAVDALIERGRRITLIANSIGAYFAMQAGIGERIHRAFFISPVVDLEKLIRDRMAWSGVTEEALMERGVIPTEFGEDLSWEYLQCVRTHPIRWTAATAILYGSRDALTDPETISSFAEAHGARLTVMEGGEHWFHTEEQMRFLDDWIRNETRRAGS